MCATPSRSTFIEQQPPTTFPCDRAPSMPFQASEARSNTHRKAKNNENTVNSKREKESQRREKENEEEEEKKCKRSENGKNNSDEVKEGKKRRKSHSFHIVAIAQSPNHWIYMFALRILLLLLWIDSASEQAITVVATVSRRHIFSTSHRYTFSLLEISSTLFASTCTRVFTFENESKWKIFDVRGDQHAHRKSTLTVNESLLQWTFLHFDSSNWLRCCRTFHVILPRSIFSIRFWPNKTRSIIKSSKIGWKSVKSIGIRQKFALNDFPAALKARKK